MAGANQEQKVQSAGSITVNETNSITQSTGIVNETVYQAGEKARITTEEAEIENHICWETMIGQEIVKLVTMDLIITIASIFIIDFFRGLWIKYCSSWWCWDIESTFPEYGEFKVAENVLHIINNQGMIWLGLFFAPLLPALNNLKLIILMYIRAWACMTCNVPAREIFRASRSSNFYLMVLLLWLLLCTLPVGYVIASKRPSSACGPFAGHAKFYNVLTQMLEGRVDRKVMGWLRYIASPGVVIPILLLLILIIYFLVSLVRGLREANNDLQQQLIHERTEEKRKIFELAGGTTKKKLSDRGRDKRKRTVTYLPLVEQKRREPWRAYNGRENGSSLCVTDETSTLTTIRSDQSPSPKNVKKKSQQMCTTAEQTAALKHHATSVSPQIIHAESSDRNVSTEKIESNLRLPTTYSRVTDRPSNDWFIEDAQFEMTETQSCDIDNGVIEEANLEEMQDIGSFSINDQLLPSSSRYDRRPNVVIPPTLETTAPTYQSRSKNGRDISSVSYSQPKRMELQNDRLMSVIPNVEKQISQGSDIDNMDYKTRDTKITKASRAEIKGSNHEFAPWTSSMEEMEEIQPFRLEEIQPFQRDQLQQKLTDDLCDNGQPSNSSVDEHHNTELRAALSNSETNKCSTTPKPQQQRRFRISVSPTRRFQTHDPSGSDTDTSTGKRRYVIKQQVLPDSTVSVNMVSRTPQQQPET